MRAVVVREFGGPETVTVVDEPLPEPGPGEVRIRVAGAGVSNADVMFRTGAQVEYGATLPREQYGLGIDLAGVVDGVGEDVERFAVGDHVVAVQERVDQTVGLQAEYAVLEEWALAPAPVGADLVDAASFPLNAMTADGALDTLDLKPGQWLLITGAAGGVGGLAIELAVLRGLRVVAEAGADDEALVRSLGARLFVPRGSDLTKAVRELVPRGVDGALDAANRGTAADGCVAHGGAYVSLLNAAPQSRRGVRTHNFAWQADPGRLAKLSALAGAGLLTLRVAETYKFEDAQKAHEAMAKGGLRGRLILTP